MKPETKITLERVKLICVIIVSILIEVTVIWAAILVSLKNDGHALCAILFVILGLFYIPPTIDVIISCVSSIDREKEKIEERYRRPINE